MRKSMIGGVAVIAASILFLSAFPQESARVSLKYGDRLQPLIGKRFGINGERDTVYQYETGEYTLAAVGVDYAEFHSDDRQVLVPLSVLRASIERKK
jgi:hypothetical protein